MNPWIIISVILVIIVFGCIGIIVYLFRIVKAKQRYIDQLKERVRHFESVAKRKHSDLQKCLVQVHQLNRKIDELTKKLKRKTLDNLR